jgi:hypothetical protein
MQWCPNDELILTRVLRGVRTFNAVNVVSLDVVSLDRVSTVGTHACGTDSGAFHVDARTTSAVWPRKKTRYVDGSVRLVAAAQAASL